jgi:hypothetical protein
MDIAANSKNSLLFCKFFLTELPFLCLSWRHCIWRQPLMLFNFYDETKYIPLGV